MWALIFLTMWAADGTLHMMYPRQFFDRPTCIAIGQATEAGQPTRWADDPRGPPTATHWWCVPTDEGLNI